MNKQIEIKCKRAFESPFIEVVYRTGRGGYTSNMDTIISVEQSVRKVIKRKIITCSTINAVR